MLHIFKVVHMSLGFNYLYINILYLLLCGNILPSFGKKLPYTIDKLNNKNNYIYNNLRSKRMQEKLDNLQKTLWDIYLVLLKTDISQTDLKQVEDLLHKANTLHKTDKEVSRLCNLVYNYNLSQVEVVKYTKILRKALNQRTATYKNATTANLSNTTAH